MTEKKRVVYTIELIKIEEKDLCYFTTKVKGRKKISISELFGLIEVYKYTLFKEAGVGSKALKHEAKYN